MAINRVLKCPFNFIDKTTATSDNLYFHVPMIHLCTSHFGWHSYTIGINTVQIGLFKPDSTSF